MKKILSLSIALFAFVTFSFAQTAKPAESNGLLYKISGKGLEKPSYLYGTIHVICPNDMFAMDKINTHFQQTERLILELDMDDPSIMQKMMTALNMPDGKTLKDLLAAEKYTKVDEMFKNVIGVPVAALGSINPMGLSIVISTTPKSTGCAVPASYETTFVEMATKAKMPIEGLESVEDQIAAIAKTPLEKQAEDLYKLSLEPEKAVNQFKELLAAYKTQDAEKLTDYIAQQSTENPDFQTNLLDERNKNWIPKIEKAMTEKPTFFAVGGGHLGGKTGVVKLLREKGYTVTAIKF